MVVSEFGVNAKKGYTRVSGCCWSGGYFLAYFVPLGSNWSPFKHSCQPEYCFSQCRSPYDNSVPIFCAMPQTSDYSKLVSWTWLKWFRFRSWMCRRQICSSCASHYVKILFSYNIVSANFCCFFKLSLSSNCSKPSYEQHSFTYLVNIALKCNVFLLN